MKINLKKCRILMNNNELLDVVDNVITVYIGRR